jgi:hypothetical protein
MNCWRGRIGGGESQGPMAPPMSMATAAVAAPPLNHYLNHSSWLARGPGAGTGWPPGSRRFGWPRATGRAWGRAGRPPLLSPQGRAWARVGPPGRRHARRGEVALRAVWGSGVSLRGIRIFR